MRTGTGSRWPALLLLAAACSGGDAGVAARTLEAFQTALQRGDREACRALVTRESAAALDVLPWQEVRHRQPLIVRGTERSGVEHLVEVEDPNDGGRRSQFVVVREHGRFVVDLVATAGRHVEVVGPAEGAESFEPRPLTPQDHDRIRQYELAQPPR